MKKINSCTWQYKGCYVYKDLCGNYVANVFVNDLRLPMKICGITQNHFKDNFNRIVKTYGGLKR